MKWLVGFSLVLLLGACSSYQLLYNQADKLLLDRLESHVELGPGQRNQIAQRLEQWHLQHRYQQLPEYRELLVEIHQAVVAKQVNAERLQAWLRRIDGSWLALRQQAWPVFDELFAILSKPQRRQLIRGLNQRLKDRRLAHQARDQQQRFEYRLERSERQLERWLGELLPEQRSQLIELLKAMPDSRQRWLDYRQRWLDRFEQALLAKDRQRMESLILAPQQLHSVAEGRLQEAERQVWLVFFEQLEAGLSRAQRAFLVVRLERLIVDLQELSEPE